jgi:hypothetical protein
MLKLQLMLPTMLCALMSLSTQAPALGPATDVLLVSGGRRTPLPSQTAEPRSRNHRIGFLGFSKDLLTVDGVRSSLRITARQPSFELRLPTNTGPDDVFLVRLTPKGGRREVGMDHETSNELHDDDLLPLIVRPADPVDSDNVPHLPHGAEVATSPWGIRHQAGEPLLRLRGRIGGDEERLLRRVRSRSRSRHLNGHDLDGDKDDRCKSHSRARR